ncbi:MAG: ATP-grasp domain-containing protein [Streptosporangiaceae bacterium]
MTAPGRAPFPCVVLASRACDADLGVVAALLAKIGVSCLRLDADSVASLRLLADAGTGVLQVGEHRVMPTVSWVRHFTARAIRASGGGARDLFLRDSWQALITQLGLVSRAAISPQRPGLLMQLRTAANLGVSVPRTVAVSDLSLAREAIPAPRLVLKALAGHFVEAAPGRLTGTYPEVVDRRRLNASWPQPTAPVLVQEFIEHRAELRVYYVSGDIHGFIVTKAAPSDLWLDPGRVRACTAALSPAVRSATRRIAQALGLNYAALDFLMRDSEPVFLEANPDGDWRWLETRAGTAEVTTAVARMLRDLHRESIPARPGGGPVPGRFDLLRFLA